MSVQDSDATMAVFLDLENIALGAHDADFPAFDIRKVLERLLLKGQIVVKKAYCDFERYKTFKRGLHEAAFELIEIPHLRQSGKNSADIRMVVDALDLCYTKGHVDSFVIISGDSDFSPLVSKLRENAKMVIGVGVKNSTSDLLIANCDEFIFYDDLVRRKEAKKRARKKAVEKTVAVTSAAIDTTEVAADMLDVISDEHKKTDEQRKQEALDLVMETIDALFGEREEEEKVWGSMVKQAIRRRRPGFNESYYGFRTFSKLLEEAQARRLLDFERDDKSGGYIIKSYAHEE